MSDVEYITAERPLFPADMSINTATHYDIYKYWQQSSEPYTKGIPVAFFTTPCMNFTSTNSNRSAYFSFIKETYPDLYSALTCMNLLAGDSSAVSTSPFVRQLSNGFKGITGKDLTAKTIDIGETFYGYKQSLPGPTIDSVTGDTVSVKFIGEKNLHIIHLHKLWMEYIENVSRGFFIPFHELVQRSELDYVSTLYYFVLDYDMETILYYSRYTGIAPISNPYSALVTTIGDRDIPEIDIEYVYSYKEDLTPNILMDFNKIIQNDYINLRGITNTSASHTMPIYSDFKGNKDVSRSVFGDNPVICKHPVADAKGLEPKMKYKLVFKE